MEPTSTNFQGFPFPYFKLTKDVLVELELIHPNEELPTMLVHYFNPELDYWVKMKMDSTIIITSPGQRLFFKAINVKSFPSFDHLYGRAASSLQEQVNFRTRLVQERQQFKHRLVETEIQRRRTPQPQPHPLPQSPEVIDLSACSDVDDDASTVVGGLTPQLVRHSHKDAPEPLWLTDSRQTSHADGE